MSLYLDRAHQRAVSFLRYHTGHLRYKWHQLNRIVKELKEESPWLLVVIIVILTVLLVNFIFVTWIACKFIPLWLTLFLQLIALWFIVKFVALALVFPGSTLLWRRRTEAAYCEEFSNQCVPLFDDLRAFLDNRCTRPEQATRPQTAVFMIEGLLRNFDDQTNNLGVTLTEDQQELRDALKELSDWMQATRLEVGGSKKMSFKEYMCRGEFAHHWVKFDKTKHDLARPMEALRDCDRLLGSDDDSETVLSNLRKSFKPQLLGSLYHLRSELINRYHARSFTAEKLDGVYIPSYRQQSLPESSPESGAHLLENKVIVWCNPNAGYYECAVYQHEWLDFYLGLGYGVVLWNYRGFGASKGLCTPGSLCADSETIMQWVATQGAKRGPGFVQRVGVHGRSIGGVTACHFGKVYDRPRPGLKLDFVVADRSFRTLEATARSTFGNWAAMALRLTGTTAHNVDNFLAIHDTPKILMCDPRDTIIPEDANLRTGVAARLVGDLPPELRISAVSRRTLYEASLALAYLTRFLSLIGVDESSESDETSIEELLFILGRSRDDRISTIAGLGASHHRSSSFTSCEDAPTRSAHTTGRYIQLQELGGSAAANSDGSPSSGISDQEANHRPPPQLTQRGRSIEMVTPTDDTPAASIGTYTVEELSSSVTPYLAEMKEILNIIRSRLDAGGQPLADIGTGELPDYRDSSSEHWALTEWLDKMQVWGSLTPIPDDAISVRVKACPYYPRVAEDYARETSRISGALYGDSGVDSMSITPFALLRWHREQAALAVANFSEELSRVVQKMRSAVEHSSATSGTVPAPVAAALWAAMSLENLLVEVRRGFLGQECPNAPAALASSTSTAFTLCPCMFADLETNLTAEDHRLALYDCPVQTGDCWCVHIHCGHNDTLSKVEERELRMHVRYAMSISAGQDDSDQQHQQDGGGLAE
ncbi:hypothetical protein FOL47_009294 [Perkinsus chesapeaki]|uniref:Uncharacterized protein n=1 Tax=Perkinsus chesapeaki TaxID=330153 RepID=A0A7J6MS23_PERCH|nr:hypothetical protein FOL47_009294 [Perkinsus chesapeaki]